MTARVWNAASAGRLALLSLIVGAQAALMAVHMNPAQASNYFSGGWVYLRDVDGNKAYRQTEIYWDNWVCTFGICGVPLYTIKANTSIINSSYSYRYELIEPTDYYGPDSQYYGVTLTYWNTPGSSPVYSPYAYYDDLYHVGIPVVTSTCYDNDCQVLRGGGGALDEVTFPYNSNNPYRSYAATYTSYP